MQKDITQERPDGKDAQGGAGEKGEELHALSGALRASADPEALPAQSSGCYGCFAAQARLMKSLAIGNCAQSPLLLSLEEGAGTESFDPLVTWLVPLATSPILRRPRALGVTKDTFMILLRKFQGF